MQRWKKGIGAVLLCSLVFCIVGCAGGRSPQKNDKRLKVVATVFAEYDFLRNIAGDRISLEMLMLPGADLHTFDPTPKDIMQVQEADLFVTIGGESDAWADKIIESVDSKNLQTIRLMDCVDHVVEEDVVEGMEAEGEQEEGEKEFDEHVWTSPPNAIQIVESLCEKLCSMDQENKGFYRENAALYIEKLQDLDASFRQLMENGVRKEIIVADRFPFRYFADAYGLDYYAAFPGCSTQTGASAETIAFLIRKVEEDKIPVVFHMELSSELMCNTICDETGAKKAQLNAVHNISRQDFDKGIGYLELMQENVAALKEALY